MSIGKFAGLFLLIVSLFAHPTLAQQKDFDEPDLNLKLESSDVVKLDIKTSEFGLRMTDQVCEFTGSGKDTGVIGALLRGNENIPLKDYADRVMDEYKRIMAAKADLVSEEKLDRQPGEWILREYRVEEFGSTMRHFHIIVKDGRDNYALLVVSYDTPKARPLAEHIATKLTVGGVAGQVGGDRNVGNNGKKPGVAGIVFTGPVERDLFLLKEGEAKPINITKSPGWDYQPAFSRDGSKLVFLSCRNSDNKQVREPSGLYTMNADGSDVKWIVKDDGVRWPRWSHDGSKIVYITKVKFDLNNHNFAVCTVNADGSDRKTLTPIGQDFESADWSPDGSKIVASAVWKDQNTGGLFTMNPDGSDLKQILSTHFLDAIPRHPKWSPDGKQIIFTGKEWQEVPHAGEDYFPWGATMICNADGTNVQMIHATHDSLPRFMPNMNKIIFLAMHGGDYITSGNQQDLFIKNVNGVQTLNITKDIGGAADFDVSPVSSDLPLQHAPVPTDIVFARLSSGGPPGSKTAPGPSADLFVIDEYGKTFANITQSCTYYAREDNPCWSPDKTKIIFESNYPYWIDGERNIRTVSNIWMCDADGSNRINLTKHNGNEYHPIFSADGTRIMFNRESQLMELTLATGEVRKVKSNTVPNRHMTWSNDMNTFVISGMEAINLTTNPEESTRLAKGESFDPDWNPIQDEVANFGWNEKNEYGLQRFNFPDGADAQVVVIPRGTHPSWSPDGYRIVFDTDPSAGDSNLLIADIHKPDLKDTINITQALGGKNFSPDWASCPHPKAPEIAGSNCLVVACRDGDDFIIYMIKTDGTDMKEVARFKGPVEGSPTFSPNGQRAAVYVNRDGKFQLFLSDLDGKAPRKIADGYAPVFSPDGNKLAYIPYHEKSPRVSILDLTRANAQPIPRAGANPSRGDSAWMAWSPDGKKLVFLSDLLVGNKIESGLFSIDENGQNCTKLTDIDGYATGVYYAADGKRILVQITQPGGASMLQMINADGSNSKAIASGNYYVPKSWTTPDGSRMFVVKDGVLYSMNYDGSDPKKLADGNLALHWWKQNGANAAVIGIDERRNSKLLIFNADGSNPRWINKLNQPMSYEWCGEGSIVKPKDEVVAVKGDFVLKDGTYKLKTTYGEFDPASGYSVNNGVITRSYTTKVGWGDEAKPVTYTGQLNFTAPPATLKPGDTFELSLSASGDYQTSMMGEWFIGSGKKEGIDTVAIPQPGIDNAWPASGKLKVSFGEVVGDRYQITLTVEKFLTVSWVYERK